MQLWKEAAAFPKEKKNTFIEIFVHPLQKQSFTMTKRRSKAQSHLVIFNQMLQTMGGKRQQNDGRSVQIPNYGVYIYIYTYILLDVNGVTWT